MPRSIEALTLVDGDGTDTGSTSTKSVCMAGSLADTGGSVNASTRMESIATIPTIDGWAHVFEDEYGQFVIVDGVCPRSSRKRMRTGVGPQTRPPKQTSSMTLYSKQDRWRAKQRAAGRCVKCGQLRGQYKWRCDKCVAKARKRGGFKPWRPGGPGRTPAGAEPFWTPARDEIVRRLPAKEAAAKLGVALRTLYDRRSKLGIRGRTGHMKRKRQ